MLTELTVQHELFGDGCSLRVGEQGVSPVKLKVIADSLAFYTIL